MAAMMDFHGISLEKESIKRLIKVTDSPSAWAAYDQLWHWAEKAVALSREVQALRMGGEKTPGPPPEIKIME